MFGVRCQILKRAPFHLCVQTQESARAFRADSVTSLFEGELLLVMHRDVAATNGGLVGRRASPVLNYRPEVGLMESIEPSIR